MHRFNAYRIFEKEGQVSARLVELGIDDLDPGEVLIRNSHSSVNYKDALAATGTGRVVRRFPIIGGVDVAGMVVTSSDPRFREGEAVLVTGYGMGVEHDGGYAEYSRVPADWVVPLPPGMSPADGMAIGTAGFTAALAIMRMEQNGLKPANGPVVVTGASGGVGSVAVDLLAGLGYEVTAISGKDDQHEYLRHLGASQVLSRHTLEMGRKPLEKTIWAGAVDPVGGETLAWLTRTMKQHGTIASCGLTAGVELHTTVMPFILRGVSLLGIDSVQCPMALRRSVWERLASDMRPRHLKEMTRTIHFDQLPETFDALLKGAVKGRVVVEIQA
ncbi:MAG: oxidoreductase [Gammaproteobacteria bacterium]|nr:oxidoreductase [Gammaproteobacteria bacterium]MBU1979007.1 oxidoreductase [Gammaproteobacteria bacterium]